MGWTQTGRNPALDGEWAGAGSKANFKSLVEITSPNGTQIPFTGKTDGMNEWDAIPPNSVLKWKVNTDGKSDRVELKLQYFNSEKYLSSYNAVMDSLTEEELKLLESGDSKFIESVDERAIQGAGGLESLFNNIWSRVVSTNETGDAEGIITIDDSFPKNTSYIFMAHYGYDVEQEKGDTRKTVQFVWDIASISLMFVPGANVVVGAAVWAAFVTEMAVVGAKMAASDFGRAGKNKHGKFFPMGGFNHGYMFFLEDPEETQEDYVSSILSDENLDIIQKMNLLTQFYGVAKVGGILAGSLIFISLLKRRR